MSVQQPPVWTPLPPDNSPVESSALGRILWYGVISLLGMVTSWVVGFYTVGTMFSGTAIANLGSNPSSAQVGAALGPMFGAMALLVPLSLAIELVGIVLLTSGFRALRGLDPTRFSVPSVMMLVLLAGVLMVAVGIVPFFNGLPSIIAQIPSSPTGAPSAGLASALGQVVVYLLLALVGGILALVGVVGGLILGLWRVGSRYDEPLFKIGAIFVIIPLLDVVSPILVIVAAHHSRGKLSGAGGSI